MKTLTLFCAVLLMAVAPWSLADTVQLRTHAPDRYTVVRGDTLWSIAGHFLKDPWQWPAVWNHNQQIKNPQRIFPGDVIVLSYDRQGRPVLTVLPTERLGPSAHQRATEVTESGNLVLPIVALKPEVTSTPYLAPIPTIKPDAILPFLTEMRVVSDRELRHAPYVVGGTDGRAAIGSFNTFYARGITADAGQEYLVFRKGPVLRDATHRNLGHEAIYLGRVEVVHPGSVALLRVLSAARSIHAGDRLFVAPPPEPIPYYYPRPPKTAVRGTIIAALDSVSDFGAGTIVAINLGRDQGMRRGYVLQIGRRAQTLTDPVTGRPVVPPERRSGLLMIFRPFARVSYALVMDSTRPVRLGDSVSTP